MAAAEPLRNAAIHGLDRERPDARLKAERDRFLAFSFAAADLLFEVDREGRIGFTIGASEALTGRAARDLIAHAFLDLLAEADRPLVRMLVAGLQSGGRLSPVIVRLAHGNKRAILGGCWLPTQPDTYYLSFIATDPVFPAQDRVGARDADTGLLDPNEFIRLVSRKVVGDRDGALHLSVLRLNGIDELRERAEEDMMRGFRAALGRRLRARSLRGDSAGRLDGERFGLLHQGEIDGEALAREIKLLAANLVGEEDALAIDRWTIELDRAGLGDDDARRALIYAVNTVTQPGDSTPPVSNLRDGFIKVLSETSLRVRELADTFASFGLVFQPVVSLRSNEPHHFEALARFGNKRATAGVIAIAEQAGMIGELDLAVVERVLKMLKDRAALGDSKMIAVNISGRSLETPGFNAELMSLLGSQPGLGDRLLIEITDSASIGRLDEVGRFIKSLRGHGFKVCLDDFAIGAVSFHILNAIAVDFVKIDGRFVRQATANARDMAFLTAMLRLCHELHTTVIGEMIETEAQRSQLVELGVEYGQGYVLARPSPSLEVSAAPPRASAPAKRRGLAQFWR